MDIYVIILASSGSIIYEQFSFMRIIDADSRVMLRRKKFSNFILKRRIFFKNYLKYF